MLLGILECFKMKFKSFSFKVLITLAYTVVIDDKTKKTGKNHPKDERQPVNLVCLL